MNNKEFIYKLDQIIHKLKDDYSLRPIGKENNSSALWGKIEQRLLQRKVVHLKRWNYIGWSAAMIVILIGLWNIQKEDGSHSTVVSELQIKTLDGERNSFNLKDGSKISLYPNSSVTLYSSISNTVDSIYLKGAAKFNITKREDDLLKVRTKNFDIHVLGTTFIVEDFDSKKEALTSLIEGKLAVDPVANNNTKTLILNPNEKVIIDKINHQYKKQEFTQDDYLKSKGIYRFEHITLRDYILEVEEFFGVSIEISPTLEKERYTLIIDQNKDLSEVFKDLLKIGKIKTHKQKNKHYQLTK
ncbi:FecR family protein [Prolixibacteraceae bacterium]|nr:FecR family protein [Prolixibacteraceae bacterium]